MPFDAAPVIGRTHLMFKDKWAVPAMVFKDTVSVEFEGELFSAPIGYDNYLKHRFGDYMKMPQESESVNHGTISFWK